MSAGVLATHAWCENDPGTSSAGRIYQSSQSDTVDGLELGVFNLCHVEGRIRNLLKSLKTVLETPNGYILLLGTAGGYSTSSQTVEGKKNWRIPLGPGKFSNL